MARFTQLAVDSRAPAALARLWAAALDGFEVRPYDDAEIARLAELGRIPETDPCVILAGPTFEVCFQEVATLTKSKRAVHLDIFDTGPTAGTRSSGIARRLDRPRVRPSHLDA